jgi:hypothetical protein
MAFLTILGQSREARARPGLRDLESAANRRDLTRSSDPCVDARGRGDVRTTFAWLVRYFDNAFVLARGLSEAG